MAFLRLLLLICLGSLCLLTLAPHGRALHPALDSIGHFWMHLTALTLVVSLVALWAHARRIALAGFIATFAAASAMAPVVTPKGVAATPAHAGGAQFRLLQFNTLYANDDPAGVARMIRASGADAVTLQEVTPAMRAAVETLRDIYPRQLHCDSGKRIGGVSVLARQEGAAGKCSDPGMLASFLPIRIGGQDYSLASLHLNWPWPHRQHEQVAALDPFLSASCGHVIMAGDLNAAPWSETASRLAAISGARIAPGYRPSWLASEFPPGARPWIGLPIDHAFLPPGLPLLQAGVLPDAGSDHLPVLFTVAVSDD